MSLLKSLATPVAWVLLLMAVGLILTRFGRGREALQNRVVVAARRHDDPADSSVWSRWRIWLVYSLEYR